MLLVKKWRFRSLLDPTNTNLMGESHCCLLLLAGEWKKSFGSDMLYPALWETGEGLGLVGEGVEDQLPAQLTGCCPWGEAVGGGIRLLLPAPTRQRMED